MKDENSRTGMPLAAPKRLLGTGPRLSKSVATMQVAAPPTEAFTVGTVIQPTSAHKASIILLHGLGGNSKYWNPFYKSMQTMGVVMSGVKWIALDAPTRSVWGSATNAWFEYYTNRCGEDCEDEINEHHLLSMRAGLHALIADELRLMKAAGTATPQILLAGNSQGGSVALDAGLTLNLGGETSFVCVAMLRSLALGATARAIACVQKTAVPLAPLPCLVVSGGDDGEFILTLVRRQLNMVCYGNSSNCDDVLAPARVQHMIVENLDHYTEYNVKEIVAFTRFVVDTLGLATFANASISEATVTAAIPDELNSQKRWWSQLTATEQELAKQMGVSGPTAWNLGTAPVWTTPWAKLSALQREAAMSLGFSETQWDDGDEYDYDGDDYKGGDYDEPGDDPKKLREVVQWQSKEEKERVEQQEFSASEEPRTHDAQTKLLAFEMRGDPFRHIVPDLSMLAACSILMFWLGRSCSFHKHAQGPREPLMRT